MTKKTFPNTSDLDLELARNVAELLNEGISNQGKAKILFSGGSTPIGLFRALAMQNVDWKDVQVGLVDDRIVPADHEHSNNRLLTKNFLDLLPENNKPEFFR